MNLQHMIPYANPTYFIWLMVGLLPMMLCAAVQTKALAMVSNVTHTSGIVRKFWW